MQKFCLFQCQYQKEIQKNGRKKPREREEEQEEENKKEEEKRERGQLLASHSLLQGGAHVKHPGKSVKTPPRNGSPLLLVHNKTCFLWRRERAHLFCLIT